MTVSILFLLSIAALNLIPLWTKGKFQGAERTIIISVIITSAIVLAEAILSVDGYHLKGLYTNKITALAFAVATLLYFSLVRNTKTKVVSFLFLVPLLVVSFYNLLFMWTTYQKRITPGINIEVLTGGLLSCGELIRVTETRFGILDKEIHFETSLCLRGIERIETIRLANGSAEMLIYHDGEMDSENPYSWTIENKPFGSAIEESSDTVSHQ